MSNTNDTIAAAVPGNAGEPLAVILAEMRDERIIRLDDADVTRCLLRNLADRIESAVVRLVREERTEAIDEALAHAEDVRAAKCRNCAGRSLGNAAATREALEELIKFTCNSCDERFCEEDIEEEDGIRHCSSCNAILKARAALSAPARNVDRPECATRDGSYNTWYRETWEMSREDCPCWSVWLFAPAEGKEVSNG